MLDTPSPFLRRMFEFLVGRVLEFGALFESLL